MQKPLEKLGSFYLGNEYDLKKDRILDIPINYDARDLTTHAICIGMTGSGKTGLCIGLLEEAALDKVPAILIDPKGDITNLLLQFPDLRPEDFMQWINPDDARRKEKTVEEYSQYVADLWRNGLGEWGIDSSRIRLMKESVDFSIYTPGSDAGIPISILSNLVAPGIDFEQNKEMIREKINGMVAALLELVGIKADPIRSREAILLYNVFEHFWRRNEDLDLAKLIASIQKPPIRQLGVFDLDTFYPEKDRFELAIELNNLIASSSFQSWLQGVPMDIDRLLYTEEGKPRHSVIYIAHLSDRERMFFVTLLLENILVWIRKQTGTTSLRAILYFDEVFGFFPPVAEPPSKRPLLSLLKQARAFGLGILLVTQNPVDIDYKGLANAGTWFIGKLQTERDKERVLHGLKGAIAEAGISGEKVDYDSLIGQLKSRVFLMHNVHEDLPIIFHTRWVMSYLRGPLTRPQINQLMKEKKKELNKVDLKDLRKVPIETVPDLSGYLFMPSALDPSLKQVFLPLRIDEEEAMKQISKKFNSISNVEDIKLFYIPSILGVANIRFMDRKLKIDEQIEKILLVPTTNDVSGLVWDNAEISVVKIDELLEKPKKVSSEYGPLFSKVPKYMNTIEEIQDISKDFANWLYLNEKIKIKIQSDLEIFQKPGESDREFIIQIQQVAKERRDEEIDELRQKYDKKVDKLIKKSRKLERELSADEAEYEARKREELAGVGGTVLGVLLGRKSTGSVTSIARRRRLTSKSKMEVEDTKEELRELEKDIAELDSELKEEIDEITEKWDRATEDIATQEIKPKRADIDVNLIALAWTPMWSISYKQGDDQHTTMVPAYLKN